MARGMGSILLRNLSFKYITMNILTHIYMHI